MATAAAHYTSDQTFFRRMAIGIAAFMVFAFAQWAARGFANYAQAPIWVHLHGLVMMSWLGLFITQNVLAERGALALHRRLGWLSIMLAAIIVVLGVYTPVKAIELHRVPPFFTNAYFLALGLVDVAAFAGLFAAAIVKRKDTHWHRRLMLSSIIVLLEPAFGRLVLMPFFAAPPFAAWGPLVERLLQLGVFAIAMRHDRHVLGAVHPAYKWGAGVLVASYLAIATLAGNASFATFAEGLANG